MARYDIRPSDAPHGGHNRVLHFTVGASSTFNTADTSWREGEVLLQDVAAGDINVIADGVEAVTTNHYIAAASSQATLELAGVASGSATPRVTVPVYPLTGPDAGTFITANVVTGSDTLLTSAQKDAILVGDTVGLWRDNTATGAVNDGENGTFAVDTGSTGLKLLRKLDANGRDTDVSGQTCVFFVVGQNT
jgi:hypothetical protein